MVKYSVLYSLPGETVSIIHNQYNPFIVISIEPNIPASYLSTLPFSDGRAEHTNTKDLDLSCITVRIHSRQLLPYLQKPNH